MRHTRLPAIHLWARQYHQRWQIRPIRINHTRQVRWRRAIIRLTASMMVVNWNLQNGNVLPTSVYDADLLTTRRGSALNTHKEVNYHSRTRHSVQTGTKDNKSNNSSPSIISTKITHRAVTASDPTGKIRHGEIGSREVGYTDFDCDDGQHTTASDCVEVKGVVQEPKGSHLKSVFMRHLQTEHVWHHSWGFYKGYNGEMQCVRALIECGSTCIFMALRQRKHLCLADEPSYVTTLGLNGHVMAHSSESRKTAFTVQYMEHLSPA